MNILEKGTIVQIIDKQVKYAHPRQAKYLIVFLSKLYRVDRLTKSGWYLLQTGDHFCPTISVPKKHLKVFEPKLSSYGLSDLEICLFRQFRVCLHGWQSSEARLKHINMSIEDTELFIKALAKLGYKATKFTKLDVLIANLNPLLDFYLCE